MKDKTESDPFSATLKPISMTFFSSINAQFSHLPHTQNIFFLSSFVWIYKTKVRIDLDQEHIPEL